MKDFISGTKKKVTLLCSTAALAVGSAMSAFAAEDSVSTALASGLGQVKTDIIGYIAIALPVGLGIFGAFFGIKKVIGFFRSISK